MKKTTTLETRTPKGLTQNWNFLQSYSKTKKATNFVSKSKRYIAPATKKTTEPVKRVVDNTQFSVKVGEEAVTIMPRKNGKFCGKQQVYSTSLSKKLGLI